MHHIAASVGICTEWAKMILLEHLGMSNTVMSVSSISEKSATLAVKIGLVYTVKQYDSCVHQHDLNTKQIRM